MSTLIIILTVIDAMVALLLIAVVLVQQSKDGGLGGAPFGGAGDSVFGGHAEDHLTKITVGLATTFLCLTLSLAIITGRSSGDDATIVNDEKNDKSEMSELLKSDKKDVKKDDQKIFDKIGVNKKEKPKNTIVIPKVDKNKPVKLKLNAPDKIKELIKKKNSETSPKTVVPKKKSEVPKSE